MHSNKLRACSVRVTEKFASFFYFFLSIHFFCVFVHIDFVSVNKKAKKERKDLSNTCLAILTLHLVNLLHLCRYCVCPTKPELWELFVRKGYITMTFYSRTLKKHPLKMFFLPAERAKEARNGVLSLWMEPEQGLQLRVSVFTLITWFRFCFLPNSATVFLFLVMKVLLHCCVADRWHSVSEH